MGAPGLQASTLRCLVIRSVASTIVNRNAAASAKPETLILPVSSILILDARRTTDTRVSLRWRGYTRRGEAGIFINPPSSALIAICCNAVAMAFRLRWHVLLPRSTGMPIRLSVRPMLEPQSVACDRAGISQLNRASGMQNATRIPREASP